MASTPTDQEASLRWVLFAFLPWFWFQEAKSQESKEAPKPTEEAKSEDENDHEKVQEADDRGTAIDLRLIITIRLLAQRTFLPSSQLRQILYQVRCKGAGSAKMLQEQLKVSLQSPLFWSSQAP